MSSLSLFLYCASALATMGAGDKPAALLSAEAAHGPSWISTARVELSVREGKPDGEKAPHTRFFTWRCAGDEYLNVDRGAEDGIVHRGPDGREAPITYTGPRHSLFKDGEVWTHVEDSLGAVVFDTLQADVWGLFDLRRLGVDSWRVSGSLEERAAAAGQALRYESARTQDGLELVSASTGNGKFQWFIDPQRGWSVVRTTVWMNGGKIGETRYDLKEFDGVWFPKRMEHYRLAAGETEPFTVIEVLSAEFNRPEHPQKLTPASIGVEAGMSVTFRNKQPAFLRTWDGEKPVRFADFVARVKNGEVQVGPTVARAPARSRARRLRGPSLSQIDPERPGTSVAGKSSLKHFESEWEAYTRRFIARFILNAEQKQKALGILKDCQERGNQYLARRRAEFERLEKLLQELKSPSSANTKVTVEKRRLLDEKHAALKAPIDHIFETQLKPRLDKLPTRAQRQAAQQRGETNKKSGKDDD